MAGLYVHIPFCHSKCAYCDFYSTPDRRFVEKFFESLKCEYEMRRSEISEPFRTVYFGGGTPSIVEPRLLRRFVELVDFSEVEEFTIEVNPEDVIAERVKQWRELGVNRVSMGVQTFSDEELRAIGRRHSSKDALMAIETLRTDGIDNISCDLIYGLPGQSKESWLQSLDKMLSLELPHLSAYCLSYEPGTALNARRLAGKIQPIDDDVLLEMYDTLCQRAKEEGYEHYEISNFAKAGMRSRHNSSYWDSTPYLGLGPGAHNFDGKLRRYNPGNLKLYLENPIIAVVDDEDESNRFNDRLITALRTSDGIKLDEIDADRAKGLMQKSAQFLKNNQMSLSGNRLRINEHAWFVSDLILVELIEG